MMVRTPVDLLATTRDVKLRIRRVIGELEAIERHQDPCLTPAQVGSPDHP